MCLCGRVAIKCNGPTSINLGSRWCASVQASYQSISIAGDVLGLFFRISVPWNSILRPVSTWFFPMLEFLTSGIIRYDTILPQNIFIAQRLALALLLRPVM